MRALETHPGSASLFPYELTAELPFVLLFAQRRNAAEYLAKKGTSQSDGATTGQDGGSGGSEDFDWLSDD